MSGGNAVTGAIMMTREMTINGRCNAPLAFQGEKRDVSGDESDPR